MSLVVTRVLGLVTVQDLGRPGSMHVALPPGGALVPERLVAANRTAGAADDAPAIEIMGLLVVRAEAALVVATDTSVARALQPGDELGVRSEPRRVSYLALAGGVSAPLVLGGRGAQLSAGLGARIRAGDRFAPGQARMAARAIASEPDGPIRVIAGPDGDAFEPRALAVLTSADYRIAPTSDRVGTRLDGPPLPRRASYVEASRPMVGGAIEVPRDGAPIVLGPEHPTTGGYPIVAVVARGDLGRLFSIRLGGRVRFVVGS